MSSSSRRSVIPTSARMKRTPSSVRTNHTTSSITAFEDSSQATLLEPLPIYDRYRALPPLPPPAFPLASPRAVAFELPPIAITTPYSTQFAAYPLSPTNTDGTPRTGSEPRFGSFSSEGSASSTLNPHSQERLRIAPWESDDILKDGTVDHLAEPWIPLPLRPWFWIPLVLTMGFGAIAFELVLMMNKRDMGWATKGRITTEQGVMHYLYTFPPVAISMIFAALWAWTDIEIRKLQPYIDLAHGNSPPRRSLLLDYTRSHTLWVWVKALRNQHWIVTIASLLVILTFSFQPLSATLLNVQDIWWTEPDLFVKGLSAIGLNQNRNFQDLTSFLTAAGYASANGLYDIGDPRFVYQGWVIGEFELPTISNGTVYANTTAVLTESRCVSPDPNSVSMTPLADGTGWRNMASFEGCEFAWDVNRNTINLFGVGPIPDSNECSHLTSIPQQYRPILFWFFTYDPEPMSSISMCTPTLSLWNVETTLDLATHNLTDVKPMSPFIPSLISAVDDASDVSRLASNISGYPMNGRAYNGLFFDMNVNASDPYVNSRMTAIQLALPAAVFQAAVSSEERLTGVFQSGDFVHIASRVYGMYLSLLAKTVYFLHYERPVTVRVKTIHKRLFLSEVAVHLLATAMLILAVLGTVMQLSHRRARQRLHIAHPPGTIASAVSISGRSEVGDVLLGKHNKAEMKAALEGKRFGLGYEHESGSLKLVMEHDAKFRSKGVQQQKSFVDRWMKKVKEARRANNV